jgi:RimJ/RimL family protein N-acetyltransferase
MFNGPFDSKLDFQNYLKGLQTAVDSVGFIVVDKASNQKIGIINFLNVVSTHRRVEIGGIWYQKLILLKLSRYTPAFHRTYANTESCYLLAKYCFEVLEYRRFEWKCGMKNNY